MMGAFHRPTMKDVAARARVSVSTVSYVLNNSGSVAEERRERILAAVSALKYEPNESARRLKNGRASVIGLVIPDLANQFFALLAKGVERAATEHDVLVVLCSPQTSEESESNNARLLRSRRVDGVVYLSGFDESPKSLIELQSLGPVVLVDEERSGLALPAILSDSRKGARQIAEHVFDQGHRKVGIIGGPSGLWTAQQRLAGYREACSGAGLDPDKMEVLDGDYREDSGFVLAKEFLKIPKRERPTALICANDLMAVGVVQYCKSIDIQVPEELSVIGFDDIPIAEILTPRLSTVRQPAQEMGYLAAELLLDLLNFSELKKGLSTLKKARLVPVEVRIRDSVVPPKGTSK